MSEAGETDQVEDLFEESMGAASAPNTPGGSEPGAAEESSAVARQLTYEEASARIEEIIRRLDSGQASLNETLELLGEGKTLIELCARELSAVGDALQELRLDELINRLEGAAGG